MPFLNLRQNFIGNIADETVGDLKALKFLDCVGNFSFHHFLERTAEQIFQRLLNNKTSQDFSITASLLHSPVPCVLLTYHPPRGASRRLFLASAYCLSTLSLFSYRDCSSLCLYLIIVFFIVNARFIPLEFSRC